jgi:hypothetical protein
VAQKQHGILYVVDEIVIRRATTPDACKEFCARWGEHPGGIIIYGDAAASHGRTTGVTDLELIRSFFRSQHYCNVSYHFARSNPDVRSRVHLLNALLRPTEGEPQLYIGPQCRELIADLEQVSYKPGSTVIDKDKDPRRTHLSDALGYLVWAECRPRAGAGEQGHRLTLY